MLRSPPTLADRARGTLLGLATGNALGLPSEALGTAEAIRARYPEGIGDVVRCDRPESPYDDDVALAVILAEELAQPDVDLERLARRWVHWADTDARGIGAWTREALAHLARRGAPPADSGGQATNGAVSRCLPIALATYTSPRNLVSGTYHTAALTHPDPRCTWSAVAVNVAAARFLRGARDFIPDVIDALRTNEAPGEVLEAVRRVPLERRDELQIEGPAAGDAVPCMEIALWFAYHEPVLERGVIWLANAGGDTDTNAAVAGGLMGARDGEHAIPVRWVDAIPQVERLGELAERLVAGRGS